MVEESRISFLVLSFSDNSKMLCIHAIKKICRTYSPVMTTFKYSDDTRKKTIKAAPVDADMIKDVNLEAKSQKESKRLSEFRKKLRETTPIGDLGDQPLTPPSVKEDTLPPWPDNKNPHTGEVNGPRGPEPTRYGDWERKGRVSDF